MKKKRTFRTYSYRGIELEQLLDMQNEEVSIHDAFIGPNVNILIHAF